jgi:putative flippase GtrA
MRDERHAPVPQLGRFLVVGVTNTIVSVVVYTVLLALGTPYLVAAPIAFLAGAVNGYILNRRWTFAARDTMRARALYLCVAAGGTIATSLLVALFVALGLGEIGAFVLTIPPVTVLTFLANRHWTFRRA